MTALLTADRFGLRCADPSHAWHGQVFVTCPQPDALTAYLGVTSATCFELVEQVAEAVWEARDAQH